MLCGVFAAVTGFDNDASWRGVCVVSGVDVVVDPCGDGVAEFDVIDVVC